MNTFALLRYATKVIGGFTGGVAVFTLWMAVSRASGDIAVKLAVYAAVYFSVATALVWIETRIPDHRPPRQRGNSLLDRILDALD